MADPSGLRATRAVCGITFSQADHCHEGDQRPNRFFGEAGVAIAEDWSHGEGWYSSFQWLTSRKWTDETVLNDPFQRDFKEALRKHFPRLAQLQAKAAVLAGALGVERPRAPDLWLIRRDEHWFLEVKVVPKDRISEAQLAGLALIATCLPSAKKVNVGAVFLHDENFSGEPTQANAPHQFERYCTTIASVYG